MQGVKSVISQQLAHLYSVAKDVQTAIMPAGIVSCMAFNPDRKGQMAAGSYSGQAALYDSDSNDLLFLLQGQKGGLTQVHCKPKT